MKFNKILLPVYLITPLVMSSGTIVNYNSSNGNTVNVTFQLDDGAVFESTGLNTKTINVKKSLTWKYVKAKAPTAKDIYLKDYTFRAWQLNKTGKEEDDIKDEYIFENDVTLYSSFNEKDVTITFALPDDPAAAKKEFELPATSAKLVNGTIWNNVKDIYIPRLKDEIEASTVYFVNFKNKNGEILGTNIGTEAKPLDSSLTEDQKTFTATFADNKTKDFTTDTWDVFIAAANKGFENMSTVDEGTNLGYKKAFTDNGGTFVGLTRKVPITETDEEGKSTSVEYTVKVIDQKADSIFKQDKKVTSLTFEFVDVIDSARSYASSFNVTNEWKTSGLRQSLYKGGDLFSILPKNLQRGIKQIKKTTYKGLNAEYSDLIETDEYLFPLSLSEIGYSGTIGDASQQVLSEGKAYKYYENASSIANRRDKKYNSNNIKYYLRSPQLDISVCSWYIDTSNSYGTPKKAMDVTYGLGVAPAFGIGETTIV